MKLKVGHCACTKKGRIYTRKEEGYRFLVGYCPDKYKDKKMPCDIAEYFKHERKKHRY